MAISKLIFNGVTQMDLTSDTVTASVLNSGYTAHDAAGEAITGTGSGGGDSWSWLGKNPTLVQTYSLETVYFKDTSFASWTWSTTQETFQAAQSLTQFTGDNSHEYVGVFCFRAHYDYGNWTPVSAMADFSLMGVSAVIRIASNVANAQSGTLNTLSTAIGTTDYRSYYYNSSGSLVFSTSAYGIFANNMYSPSITSGSTAEPKITFITPVLYTRGNATYFSETAYQNLNMNTSYYQTSCQVWRIDQGTYWFAHLYDNNLDSLNNGL